MQFRPGDRGRIESVVHEILRLKAERPTLFDQSTVGLRSIPDWLLLGPEMRVACDAYQRLWVGADGTVQQCYVTFRLGNLHEQRLSEMLFGPRHRQAALDAFRLNCPNCHCHYDRRVAKDRARRQHYAQAAGLSPAAARGR